MPEHGLEHVEEVDQGWESHCVCGWSGWGYDRFDAELNFAHGHGQFLRQKPEVLS